MSEDDLLIVTEEEAGKRLDHILSHRFKGIKSRTYFQYLIESGKVLLNGQPVKKRVQPKLHDEIEIEFILTPEMELTPEAIPLDILYEDEAIIVINKSPGMVVHPAAGNWSHTFVNALLYHCNLKKDQTLRPGIVHRLDKDTSGVLIAAKTVEAQNLLIQQFSSRQVYKEYLAICVGNPGNGKIEAPIGRHPVNRKMMSVIENGKPAITHIETLSTNGALSVVKAVLETGRTHQIRVHLKYKNTPVLGDSLYGSTSSNAKHKAERQLLHAYILRLKHPLTQKVLEFKAPIPDDLQKFCSIISSH
jgi:23S rRNA pseudouridine1911/1915/1917 synthase